MPSNTNSDAVTAGVEYCSRCDCHRCSARNRDASNQSAIAADPGARCWYCECGWVMCYTQAEIAEYGEPSECGKCYRERLEEGNPPALAKARPSTGEMP